jgi:hypothetical protein
MRKLFTILALFAGLGLASPVFADDPPDPPDKTKKVKRKKVAKKKVVKKKVAKKRVKKARKKAK